jgi:hypothetical protein
VSGGKPGVLVRGSCAAGHVTETNAAGRRVTWEGTCATDGCDLPVKARRVPGDRVAPPPDPAAGDGADSHVTVVRVDDYDDTSSGAQGDAGGFHVADDGHTGELVDPAPADEGDRVGSPPDPLDDHGERPSRFTVWRERRRAARSARRSAGYRHPLGL